MRKSTILLILAVCVSTVLSAATVIPGRWERVESLKRGSEIRVQLDSGDSFEGEFQGLEDEALLLRLANDSRREIPRSAVDLIEKRFRKSDPVWTGAAIGAAAGGGFGAVIVSQGDIVYSVVPISMLIGAGIGTLIDAAHVGGGQAYEVIYRR